MSSEGAQEAEDGKMLNGTVQAFNIIIQDSVLVLHCSKSPPRLCEAVEMVTDENLSQQEILEKTYRKAMNEMCPDKPRTAILFGDEKSDVAGIMAEFLERKGYCNTIIRADKDLFYSRYPFFLE